MEEELKELLLDYLDENNLEYVVKENKILHQCLNDEHEDTNISSYTSLVEDNVYCSCSSCRFYLDENSLISFLGIGELSQEDKLKRKLRSLKSQRKKLESDEPNNKEIKARKVYLPPQNKLFSKIMKEETYRGISKETFNLLGAYITPSDNYYTRRIIFPMYDYQGVLKSFEAVGVGKLPDLNINGKIVPAPKILRPKGENDDYFGFENLIGQNHKCPKLVIICEGLFSALSCIDLGYNGLINFGVGANIDKIQGLLEKGITHVILMGDKDKAGFSMNGNYMRMLRKSFNVKFFQHPYNADEKSDANDYHKESKEKLERLIEKNIKGWYY
jgi:DNA primase